MNTLIVIVLPEDFENSKGTRASTTKCLFATTLKREFGQSEDIRVGIDSARIGNTAYSIDLQGSNLIRDFIFFRDHKVKSLLPLTVVLTEQGQLAGDEE